MHLDPKAIEAARKATALQFPGTWLDEMCLTFLRSYLSASIPAEIGELLERLRNEQSDGWSGDACAVSCDLADEAASLIQSQAARIAELEVGLVDVTASLVAAHSLLSRSSKKAAASDKMFDQMLADYRASIDRARALLNRRAEG